jgi:hypothetical protein
LHAPPPPNAPPARPRAHSPPVMPAPEPLALGKSLASSQAGPAFQSPLQCARNRTISVDIALSQRMRVALRAA